MAKTDFILIGAGLPRTGTTSTKKALEILLPGHCYHMNSVFRGGQDESEFWMKAMEDQLQPADVDKQEDPFQCGLDSFLGRKRI